MDKIKELCIKHREILVYLIVGVMTTVFAWAIRFLWNIVFYAGTAHPLPVQTTILTIVEFIAGVSFAYPTNRKWVFRSTNPNILKEADYLGIAYQLVTWPKVTVPVWDGERMRPVTQLMEKVYWDEEREEIGIETEYNSELTISDILELQQYKLCQAIISQAEKISLKDSKL